MEDKTGQMDILKTIEQEMDSDIHPFLKKILDNIKPIGWALGGIIAAAAVYSGVTSYQDAQKAKAVSQLGSIIVQADATSRVQQLEDFAKTAPADLRVAAQLELAKTHMDAKNFDKAASAWQAVGASGVTDMRIVAGLGEAKNFMMQGEHAKAADLLTTLKQEASDEYMAMISSSLAFAAEKAGRIDAAIAEYESLKAKGDSNTDYLDYKIAALKAKPQS